MRKCNESFFELGSVGTEPALGLEALRFGEVGWVHVVAVGDAGDGSLRIVRRENGQSSVIYTPAGTFCPHRTAPPSGTTLGILCACEHLVVYGRDCLIYLPSRNTHTQPEAFLYHSTLQSSSATYQIWRLLLTRYGRRSRTDELTSSLLCGSAMASRSSFRSLCRASSLLIKCHVPMVNVWAVVSVPAPWKVNASAVSCRRLGRNFRFSSGLAQASKTVGIEDSEPFASMIFWTFVLSCCTSVSLSKCTSFRLPNLTQPVSGC